MKKKKYPVVLWGIIAILLILLLLTSLKCISLDSENQSLKQQLSSQKEDSLDMTISPTDTILTETPIQEEATPTPAAVFLSSLEDYAAGEILETARINQETLSCYFTSEQINDTIKNRIYGKSYSENPDISLDELRYLKLLHYNFNHQIQVGELIVNQSIAQDCIDIFTELFQAEYEIESMYLIDNYWTGNGSSTDTASMNDNNSSAFCYRTIAGSSKLSNHALGFAIDINPYQNPYITYKNGVPVFYHDNAETYADRTTVKDHMITHEDLCYQLFTDHGFSWGGDWKNSKDYQHFEKTSD